MVKKDKSSSPDVIFTDDKGRQTVIEYKPIDYSFLRKRKEKIDAEDKPDATVKKTLKEHTGKLTAHERQLKQINHLMVGVTIVVALGFLGLLFSYFEFVWHVNRDYRNEIKNINDQRIEKLEQRLNSLEKQVFSPDFPYFHRFLKRNTISYFCDKFWVVIT